jgi:hypothetical protein
MLSRALLNTTPEGIKGVPTNQDLEKIKSMMPDAKKMNEGIKGIPTNQDLEKIKSMMPEGVTTARNERIMQLDSLIDPDMDPGDLRSIYDDMMRESGGNYPGVDFDTFLKSIGTRKASEGGDAKEENPLRQFRDDYEMLIGFPNEVLREESKVMMELLDSDIYEKRKNHQQFKDLFYDKYAPTMKFLDSLSEEERKKALDIILSKRAQRETDQAEAKGVESLMSRGMAMADGGIVKLMEEQKDK